jgi:SNF2 family DNA or RNA helicase
VKSRSKELKMSIKRRVSNSSLHIEDNDEDEEAFLNDDEPFSSSKNTSYNGGVVPEQQLIVEKFMGRKLVKAEDGVMEEMFLVKWKGLSYLHASWERKEDLDQVDPNAKLKLKRFLLTPQLPGIMGEEPSRNEGKEDEDVENADEDEVQYFNPDMVEVQRIISCDTPAVHHSKARKPSDLLKSKGSSRKRKSATLDSSDDEDDEANDVKYLVKWRGLSYDECTWERWEDIKSYYREVWLFWQLQKPPKLPIVPPAFPTLQEYRKLEISPTFGVSNILVEEDDDGNTGLKLRDYQLEGVNWLLWNWWHKRPCILADEMGLGMIL